MALVNAAAEDGSLLGMTQEQDEADLNAYLLENQKEVHDIVSCFPDGAEDGGEEWLPEFY